MLFSLYELDEEQEDHKRFPQASLDRFRRFAKLRCQAVRVTA